MTINPTRLSGEQLLLNRVLGTIDARTVEKELDRRSAPGANNSGVDMLETIRPHQSYRKSAKQVKRSFGAAA